MLKSFIALSLMLKILVGSSLIISSALTFAQEWPEPSEPISYPFPDPPPEDPDLPPQCPGPVVIFP